MNLPPRAAAVRGDDYQHAIGWHWACRALNEPDIVSVSIEDAQGGHFDDVVIRRAQDPDTYIQSKSSNYGNVVVNTDWLTSKDKPNGRSPLQHFHATWRALREAGKPFELILLTNRGFDHADALLGGLRDLKTEKIDFSKVRAAGARSAIGKTRAVWLDNLDVAIDELADFLGDVEWKSGGSERDWDQNAKPLMRLAGLRNDDEAVTIGKAIVRSWVTNGAGAQSRQDVQRQVAERQLLARTGTLVLAVHAIDHNPMPIPPTTQIDLVDLYDGDDSYSRLQLRDPADWQQQVAPRLRAATRELEGYATKRVHVVGAMRLPLWFAIGRELPDVRGWVLSVEQRTDEWRTDAAPADATAQVLADATVDQGSDLALAIGVTHNPTVEVESFLSDAGLPVSRLLVLGPASVPDQNSVPDAGFALGWVRSARELARQAVRESGARQVHLFLAAPQGLALMLGHQWNLMPHTTVYEHMRPGYSATITVR